MDRSLARNAMKRIPAGQSSDEETANTLETRNFELRKRDSGGELGSFYEDEGNVSARYLAGVWPTTFLKAVKKVELELKPQRSATASRLS